MKELIILCVFLSQSLPLMACYTPASQEQQQFASTPAARTNRISRQWRAATYRSLIMGESKLADLLNTFGKPDSTESFDEGTPDAAVWYHFDGRGEFPGDLVVHVDQRSGTIIWMDLSVNNVSKDEAISHFGKDYIVTRYDFDDCLGDEEAAPLYESPKGSIIRIEYRERGIAVSVDETGRVNSISYVSRPVGSPSSKCKKT